MLTGPILPRGKQAAYNFRAIYTTFLMKTLH